MLLCDARHLYLFLTRLADNDIGDEGARMLAEPLGKLTALQHFDLGSAVSAVLLDSLRCCVRLCDARYLFLFLTCLAGNPIGGEKTSDLHGNINFFYEGTVSAVLRD